MMKKSIFIYAILYLHTYYGHYCTHENEYFKVTVLSPLSDKVDQ